MVERLFDPWWRDGLCSQVGVDLFFVRTGESIAAAQQACRLCPVRLKCLADALEAEVPDGVYGGFSATRRRQLLSRGAGRSVVEIAYVAIHQEGRRSTCRTRSTASS